ncbi:MAG: CoB--CoM heterodisulfide reductase iron-sulfur subunit B family protein [Candidatus Lokiarchaeota archaeon]|nr:CoB--CoM heterodisulfide reductase iron-sulfur subunit B family protein [Candidatus Lokiarchaeota archaeon]
MKYSYFPGCNLKTNSVGFEETAIAVSKKLNAELVEMPEWNCCGTIHTQTTDNLMKRIAPVRNLARAAEHVKNLENSSKEVIHKQVVTLCSMCNSTLKIVNAEVKEDTDKLEPINWQLEYDNLEYKGDMEVKHFLEILRDDIGYETIMESVEKPLKGMRIASYYGCMLLHPEIAKIDDQEAPTVMESIVQALGAEVIDWPFFKFCCGSYHIVGEEDLVNIQVHTLIDAAKKRNANSIIVACPLCRYNLEHEQIELIKNGKMKNSLPIFYFTQLMALALGIKPMKLYHFEEHLVNPKPFLKELGLIGRKKSK